MWREGARFGVSDDHNASWHSLSTYYVPGTKSSPWQGLPHFTITTTCQVGPY